MSVASKFFKEEVTHVLPAACRMCSLPATQWCMIVPGAAPLKATASCLQPAPACSPTPLCALDACRSAEALSVRQREAVDQICSELLGSAEIVR